MYLRSGCRKSRRRNVGMDYCVQLSFNNVNASELDGAGVDHVAVVEGLGCKALRVFKPEDIQPTLQQAGEMCQRFRVPVVVEVMLDRVTHISMGTEIHAITEFEELPEKGVGSRFFTLES